MSANHAQDQNQEEMLTCFVHSEPM
jgi:hypothetical protein